MDAFACDDPTLFQAISGRQGTIRQRPDGQFNIYVPAKHTTGGTKPFKTTAKTREDAQDRLTDFQADGFSGRDSAQGSHNSDAAYTISPAQACCSSATCGVCPEA